MYIWEELGISPTNNVRDIKKAYAARSKLVHPEEHPEEFRILHNAYKTALAIAKSEVLVNEEIHLQSDSVKEPMQKSELNFSNINSSSDVIQSDIEEQNTEETFDFHRRKQPQAVEQAAEKKVNFDFEASFKMNALRHNNEVMEKTEIIIKSANELYRHKFNDRESDWIKIFCADMVDEIMYEPIFLNELCRFLNSHKIYENMANAVYKTFNLGAINAESAGELETLYKIISKARADAYERLANKIKLLYMLTLLIVVIGMIMILATSLYIPALILEVIACCMAVNVDKLKKRKKSFYD